MTIGSNFLNRILEAADKDAVKDGLSIPLDAQQRALVSLLKRPLEKKIVALFSMCGIIGRLLNQEDAVADGIRAAGDELRKNATARAAFNDFYTALATAKGFTISEPLGEGTKVAASNKLDLLDDEDDDSKKPLTKTSAKLRGAMMQKKMEAVLIALGLPSTLVSTDGPGQLASYLHKTAMLIDQNGDLEKKLRLLANRLHVQLTEAAEFTVNDPFVGDVLSLLRALGVPETHLSYKPAEMRAALKAFKASIRNRAAVSASMTRLIALIDKSAAAPVKESLNEAFGELEALVDSDMIEHDILEPNGGPAMKAFYDGSGTHSETVLLLGVDPERDGSKNLKVSIDGPWDGVMHARYFSNDKDGYKNALQYANQLRSANLKAGGRPKGWK